MRRRCRRRLGNMEKLNLSQLEELRQFDTPTVYNAICAFKSRSRMEGFGHPGLIQRSGPSQPMVGYAVTCAVDDREPAQERHGTLRMEYYAALEQWELPTISVVEDRSPYATTTFWGEVQAATHLALGCVGALVEGAVRDVPGVSEQGFYLFSTGLSVASGNCHVEAHSCPVSIRGTVVKPGDLIHADMHGFVLVPSELAPYLARVCEKIAAAELPVLDGCKQALAQGRRISLEELRCWRSEMARLRKEALDGLLPDVLG